LSVTPLRTCSNGSPQSRHPVALFASGAGPMLEAGAKSSRSPMLWTVCCGTLSLFLGSSEVDLRST
jgi:hypothetical protein